MIIIFDRLLLASVETQARSPLAQTMQGYQLPLGAEMCYAVLHLRSRGLLYIATCLASVFHDEIYDSRMPLIGFSVAFALLVG